MTLFDPGDVVLIGFPFTDLSGSKQRPALVISTRWYNIQKIDVILAAITSKIPEKVRKDEYLLSDSELKSAGLPKKSIVKAGKIVTIDQRLIRKKLGRVSEQTLLHISKTLRTVLI